MLNDICLFNPIRENDRRLLASRGPLYKSELEFVALSSAVPDIVRKSRENLKKGWQTEVALDLNVIIRMEQCILHGKSLESQGLMNFVKLINDSEVVLMPGFAIGEVKAEFAPNLRAAFEAFTQKYFPAMIDMETATYTPEQDKRNRRHFASADPNKRKSFAMYYVSILLLYIVSDQDDLSGEQKFKRYLERLMYYTGIIGYVETIIAQFVFYDRIKSDNQIWSEFCKEIKENFLKSRGNVEKILLNSYNQSHDLYLLRASSITHGEDREWGKSDFWIASADKGLVNLSTILYFELGSDGRHTGMLALEPIFSETQIEDYWVKTSNFRSEFLRHRDQQFKRGELADVGIETILKHAAALEAQIKGNFSEPPGAIY